MARRVLVLGACCAGKSSLCEELRLHLPSVIECDEEVMRAAGGVWRASPGENRRMVIEVAAEALARTDVIFLTSWVPTEMLALARERGFRVVLVRVPMPELERRNRARLAEGGFSDVSHWFEPQLANYSVLTAGGLVDVEIDGTRPIADLSEAILVLDERGSA